jgi:MFS family permease
MTSISTLVIAFSAIGSGYLVDRLGPKRALAIQWSAIPVLATLFPFLQNVVLIIAVYAIWTGLDTIDTPIPPILIADHCPAEERAAALGTFSLGTRLLSSTGPTLIALALLLGPAVPFILKALMDLLGLILISGFLSQKRANTFRE